MKKWCCFPCPETPNIDISLQCLSTCCQRQPEKRQIQEKTEKRQSVIQEEAETFKVVKTQP